MLGLCGIGIGAVITGVIALLQKRPGRGMALAGVILGVIGTSLAVIITAGALGMICYTSMKAGPEPDVPADSTWTVPAADRVSESDRAGNEHAALLVIAKKAETELADIEHEIDVLRVRLPDPDEWAGEHGAGEGPEWFVAVYSHMDEARTRLGRLYALIENDECEDADVLVKMLKGELAAAHREMELVRAELR